MIMYFVATGKQPFDNCAHDKCLALEKCEGVSPILNEPEVPKCFIDIMKKCWEPNPENRPNITQLIDSLHSISIFAPYKMEFEKS
ncbi:hypothetical protein RclHR1_12120001 [Rhizophagus clarus]|uniref:Serine-threonine/tyrosine-protein kinase catalytic domain-containing protein n=1 Tax=Rhizophagus clarus TaxID=94130 RepID=A0A2Z6Q6A2_9GLOM|nr:hypothetical protein RclHR1_12120001 [Rhizophagus clarus]